MARKGSAFKGIKDYFYETRVLMGREYSLKKFAVEVLDSTVDPVMLSYIEKGKRFPNEALVQKLAQVRREDPKELLALLSQDRILYAFGRELRRVLKGPKEPKEGIADAELAVFVSRAIAALPDDGSWLEETKWRRSLRKAIKEAGQKEPPKMIQSITELLQRQGLIEQQEGKIKRLGRHYLASSTEEKRSLALEFCGIFTKGLLDKLVRQEKKTYLRNHYLQIPEEKLPEFYAQLDEKVRRLTEEFATEEGGERFLNILITSTLL
jgi:hypothetical protein